MVRTRKRRRLPVDICIGEVFGLRTEDIGHEMEARTEAVMDGKCNRSESFCTL